MRRLHSPIVQHSSLLHIRSSPVKPTAFVPPAPSLKKKQSSHKHLSAALPGNTPDTEPLLFEPERPKLPKCPELANLKH